jgi:methyl-accepting chemotaxis protein
MDMTQVIQKHTQWKIKLRTATSKREAMDLGVIADATRSELGVWLHGEAKRLYGHLKPYARCVSINTQFHIEAAKVAQAINAQRYNVAISMMGIGTPYSDASSELGVALFELKNEVNR